MYNLVEVCAYLTALMQEAAVTGSAAGAKLSQHPYCAKVVNKQQVSLIYCQHLRHNRGFSDVLHMRTSQQSGGEPMTPRLGLHRTALLAD